MDELRQLILKNMASRQTKKHKGEASTRKDSFFGSVVSRLFSLLARLLGKEKAG